MTAEDAIPSEREFSVSDFAARFGAEESEIKTIAEVVEGRDFRYRRLTQAERDAVVLSILERLDGFQKVGEHRGDLWERCWSTAKETFMEAGGAISALDPVFMGANTILRLDGDFIRANDRRFETEWVAVTRRWLLGRFLPGARRIMEFGCGSGFNLAAAARLFPGVPLVGLDWSASSVDLMNEIGARHGFDLRGRRFDFFNPDPTLDLEPGTVALTFAALEQTGPRFEIFTDWLLRKRPALVVSLEPIAENYDPKSLVDHLALRYHRHREYLDGYLTWVRKRAAEGAVELLDSRRLNFGSLYHEAYSLVVWKPAA